MKIFLKIWYSELILEKRYIWILTPFFYFEIALDWTKEWTRHSYYKGWKLSLFPKCIYWGEGQFLKDLFRFNFESIRETETQYDRLNRRKNENKT